MISPDPQQLGEFEILERLGRGGMGTVYKARQSSLGRIVALKVLPGNLSADDEFIVRFKAEARAAASLNHPGIVQVYAAGADDGVHYFAMEYVDGESLQGRLQRKGRLSPLDALAICTHVATALNHGWQRARIIHRDIKPDNIFLSSEGAVKLGDLGLAKSIGGDGSHLTQTGTAMGTPYYISPEQAHGEKTVDFRSDIYSLGCTLYHLVTGRTPYIASTPMAVMIKHITEPPPDIFKVWPECPPPLAALLARLLAKGPADRPQSYEEVIAAMLAAHEQIQNPPATPAAEETASVATDLPQAPAETAPPVPNHSVRSGKPGLLVYAAAGTVVVALLAGLLAWAPWNKPRVPMPIVANPNIASPTPGTAPPAPTPSKPTATPSPIASSTAATPRPPSPAPTSSVPVLKSYLNPTGGIVFEGASGPGHSRHVVLLAGDEEYRSEELLPQLAKILAADHGFKCTVLFSINPQTGEIDPGILNNEPGLDALDTADLCIMMLRFRNWPDAQMKHFSDYYLAGKPFIALRTSTHAFNGIPPTSPYAKYNHSNALGWPGGFGRQVLGETWTSHWGAHKTQATRTLVEPSNVGDPILRGFTAFVGSTDVYEASPPPDAKILMRGQVLSTMTDIGGAANGRKKLLNGQEQGLNEPPMPIVWTREHRNEASRTNKVFTCTMGTAAELQEESFRRLLVNASYWVLGMAGEIPMKNNAALVGEYRTHDYGFKSFTAGLKPVDLLPAGSTKTLAAPPGCERDPGVREPEDRAL